MPRPPSARKDMGEGWRKLHKYWKWNLEKKVKYAHQLIDKVFKNHTNPILCWSGGKDSTTVLHLVRQHKSNIPVVYINSGVEFPETPKFVKDLSKLWNLNIIIKRPKRGEGFWDIGSKYGWPIFGKDVASNVERALRTGNIRPQLSVLEKVLVKNKVKISARCSQFIQEKPSKQAETNLKADVKIIGLRASESRARARLWVDYGDYFFVKRYFGRNKGIWKANPIALWTDKDIWEYHKNNDIPHCKLYDKGYTRNGCWACAMGIRNGQLKRLRRNDTKLFRHLVLKTEMGEELFKAKFAFLDTKCKPLLKKRNLDSFLHTYPNFFDKI